MNKYIEIIKIKDLEKTSIFHIYNKKSYDLLGRIRWHGPWRQYCFFPHYDYETIFNIDCMKYIIEFIQKLMDERKKSD